MKFGIIDIFIIISIVSIAIAFILVLRTKSKGQLRFAFFSLLVLIFIWTASIMLYEYLGYLNIFLANALYNLTFIGVAFSPIAIIFIAIIFTRGSIKLNLFYYLLFVIPVITNVLVWTNNFHSLFYSRFSQNSVEIKFGSYFIVHSYYSYLCIVQ